MPNMEMHPVDCRCATEPATLRDVMMGLVAVWTDREGEVLTTHLASTDADAAMVEWHQMHDDDGATLLGVGPERDPLVALVESLDLTPRDHDAPAITDIPWRF